MIPPLTPFQHHVAKWKDCKRCPLCTQRNHIVLARGKVPCDILLVGEAPGDSEDVLGLPFKGPAGHLLDEIIVRAIPSTYRLAFTNLVACFPREAKAKKINEPEPAEIKACAPRLKEFVQLCKPRMIVCVGNLSEKWTPHATERIIRNPSKPAVKWCMITHPAAILRANIAQRGLMLQRCVVILSTAVEELEDATCSR